MFTLGIFGYKASHVRVSFDEGIVRVCHMSVLYEHNCRMWELLTLDSNNNIRAHLAHPLLAVVWFLNTGLHKTCIV